MPFDRKEYMKEYRKKNREIIALQEKEYHKHYDKTAAGIKRKRIFDWKRYGVINENFDELYEKFINTKFCELCSVELTTDKRTTKTTRCLDHDHESGEFRNILCHSCNTKRR